jgi:hypothetical protein
LLQSLSKNHFILGGMDGRLFLSDIGLAIFLLLARETGSFNPLCCPILKVSILVVFLFLDLCQISLDLGITLDRRLGKNIDGWMHFRSSHSARFPPSPPHTRGIVSYRFGASRLFCGHHG